ncbi:competence/damage-inducible protein A [Chromobacterium subtsugae]|uniref:Competence/damage-inducible protein A n=1 Tax=Chromobacterium subtsugae TaxID=251747 RepID=A0ABS7FFY2_9NEIS|nr:MULTISPECIES: molybdopterin-binding protein [Chromobacterium]KUM03458.1 molybdopterin-binding protein [Chromobacterium subtsugae]KZE87622.1 molybdopterin-binding protein [Chromobacterium sp. F49]MBW7567005.1 competence/damage-inducible protein A [Chromobacterium subtsugae]MBW8288676.1 competence/damage-inducible protein A [Chromobacterium subtsugae]OBU85788.1 molybdopterin-binding protein [Chromobacterium subtsugae]
MQVGALIIGDELLSGKRQDKHMQALIRILAARGIKLAWAEYLGDDPARIEAALRRAFASGDLVFSFGGIGATPDDHTRVCAARALGLPLEPHPEAKALIEARFGADAYPHRIQMGHFPQGAAIIPNPVNQIAGFSHGSVHFVPGFPSMAWPMAEWVLDTHCRHLFNDQPDIEKSCIAIQAREGDLIGLMQEFSARYPALKLSSLPSFGNEAIPEMHIEFGFAGQPALVEIAIGEWVKAIQARGYEVRAKDPGAES